MHHNFTRNFTRNLYGLVHRSSKIEQFVSCNNNQNLTNNNFPPNKEKKTQIHKRVIDSTSCVCVYVCVCVCVSQGMVKAQYSNARVGCVQMLATTNKVAGVSLLAPVSSKVALGFEYYYSLAHKDRTFCLGAQYSSPTHSVASQQPHHQHHHTTQATFTVSSFGQLATTLSHPVSLPSLDASLSASVRTTFTVPPPADMRLGARPDPPLVTAGVSYLPNRQIWNVRATVTPQQLRGRLQVEATPRKNSVVTAHLDASPNHVGWGLRGSVSF